MNIDPQFPWWTVANAVGSVLAITLCAAFTPVIRCLVRKLASWFPKTKDAERAREELEGIACEMRAEERIAFAVSLLLNRKKLSDELAEHTTEALLVKDVATVAADFFQCCAAAEAGVANFRTGIRSVMFILDRFGPRSLELEPGISSSLQVSLAKLVDSRSGWVSTIASLLKTNFRVAIASLTTANLPALSKATKVHRRLRRLVSELPSLEIELLQLLERLEEVRKIPSPSHHPSA